MKTIVELYYMRINNAMQSQTYYSYVTPSLVLKGFRSCHSSIILFIIRIFSFIRVRLCIMEDQTQKGLFAFLLHDWHQDINSPLWRWSYSPLRGGNQQQETVIPDMSWTGNKPYWHNPFPPLVSLKYLPSHNLLSQWLVLCFIIFPQLSMLKGCMPLGLTTSLVLHFFLSKRSGYIKIKILTTKLVQLFSY